MSHGIRTGLPVLRTTMVCGFAARDGFDQGILVVGKVETALVSAFVAYFVGEDDRHLGAAGRGNRRIDLGRDKGDAEFGRALANDGEPPCLERVVLVSSLI